MRHGFLTQRLLFVCLMLLSGAALAAPQSPPAPISPTTLASKPMYVTDQIKVTLRSGPGLQYQILKMVGTGDRVTALKTTASGYTQVKLADGTEGWVLSRYLMENEPAAMQLTSVDQALASAKQSLNSAQKTLMQSRSELAQTTKDKQQLQDELATLTQKYHALTATSQNAVSIQQANMRLKDLQKTNQQRIAELTHANTTLSQHSRIQWFLAGSGVLLVGLILGFLLPKLARRRKDSWFN